MQRIAGSLAILGAITIAYFWIIGDIEDKYLAMMIAALGLISILAIDVPSLIRRRKQK